jgi:hypothetical protein
LVNVADKDQPTSRSLNIPSWVPKVVVDAACGLYAHFGSQVGYLSVLQRLVDDPRMEKGVWGELLKLKKGDRTNFFYPAERLLWIDSDEAAIHQHTAMASLFYYAVSLATSAPAVVTRREIENLRGKVLDEAATLKSAAELLRCRAPSRAAIDASEAVADAARIREVEADQIAAAKTRLIVERNTGDPQARCFAILFGDRCQELFGKQMHGVTATVASVALGREITRRTVREWCSE